jgi:predicted Zn-dependent protease
MNDAERERGDAFHELLAEHFVFDQDGWAVERVRRVADRIQAGLAPEERLEPVVAWIERQAAFTLPGRYVYFSRHFLERDLSEEATAFVFAHELAHQRLGHLREWLSDVPGAWVVGALVLAAHRALVSPENQAEADRWALERCVRAGYDRERCLGAFDAMERLALDYRSADGVFGPEDPEQLAERRLRELDGERPARIDALLDDARHWLWQRRTGYPSIRERRAALDRVATGETHLVDRWRQFLSEKKSS